MGSKLSKLGPSRARIQKHPQESSSHHSAISQKRREVTSSSLLHLLRRCSSLLRDFLCSSLRSVPSFFSIVVLSFKVMENPEEDGEDETLYQRVLRMGRDLAFAMWEQKEKIAVMVLLGGTVRNVDVVWGVTYRRILFRRISWHLYIFLFLTQWFQCLILAWRSLSAYWVLTSKRKKSNQAFELLPFSNH